MSGRSSFWEVNPLTQVAVNSAVPSMTLVAGQPGKSIKVYRLKFIINGATLLEFFDGGKLIDVLNYPAIGGSLVLDLTTLDMPPWYWTTPGNPLILTNSMAVQITGNFDYLIN